MFKKDQLGVFDWIGYYILMAIPLVNIIVFFVILFGDSNPTLKHMLVAQIVMVIISVILFLTVFNGFLQMFEDFISTYTTAILFIH